MSYYFHENLDVNNMIIIFVVKQNTLKKKRKRPFAQIIRHLDINSALSFSYSFWYFQRPSGFQIRAGYSWVVENLCGRARNLFVCYIEMGAIKLRESPCTNIY